jgi:SagB-type dehydrogenase family enzyme
VSWRSGEGARVYHEQTKHSPISVRTLPHFLDWDNQPLPYKIYLSAGQTPLPDDVPYARRLDAGTLSRLLFHTAGITKHLRFPRGPMPFRAAACTGALYHIESYVVTAEIEGLGAGVYHYDPRRHALDLLRRGDFRETLIEATGGEPSASRAQAFLVLTTTYWRNAWKYRARAYRHAFWDGGTMLANLFELGEAADIPMKLLLGFADDRVHRLLGIQTDRESAVAVVALFEGEGAPPVPSSTTLEPLDLSTQLLSASEVDYPEIRQMQEASSLASGAEAREWREEGPVPSTKHGGYAPGLRPLGVAPPEPSPAEVEQVIRKRGSSRAFQKTAAIDAAALSTILQRATRGLRADSLPEGTTLTDPYLILHDVAGVPSGAYAFHPRERGLELLREGSFRSNARFLDLEQDLAADAAANLYVLVDLDPVLARYGSRGYRIAQLEGGIIGGRVYLASYALGLGATGLTFFDDAVTDFFSPHAAGKSVLFLAAFGVPLTSRTVSFRA